MTYNACAMERLMQQPDIQPVASSLRQIKKAGRFTNKSLGALVGVTDGSISHYLHGKRVPNLNTIGSLIAVIQEHQNIQNEQKESLLEQFISSVTPHIEYGDFKESLGYPHPLKMGIMIQESYPDEGCKVQGRKNPQWRRKLSVALRIHPPAETELGNLIHSLTTDGLFVSFSQVAERLGVERATVSNWYTGSYGISDKNKRKLVGLVNEVLSQLKEQKTV